MGTTERPHHTRFFSNVRYGRDDECWPYGDNKHYGRIRLGGAGSKQELAHRYSYWIHNGRSPRNFVVMHTCDNPKCVNPYHLVLGTTADNVADMVYKGRARGGFTGGYDPNRPIGSNHPLSKLTEADVLSIRKDNRGQKIIAKSYGVSPRLIHNIKTRKAWKHV